GAERYVPSAPQIIARGGAPGTVLTTRPSLRPHRADVVPVLVTRDAFLRLRPSATLPTRRPRGTRGGRSMTVRGTCLCGYVAFEADAPFEFMGHCHCSMCRKHHGAAFSSALAVHPSRFRWLRGSGLCGGVAYEIGGPVAGPIANCHCSRCRKARAAAHASNLFVQLPDFRWLRGEELVVSYKVPEAERFTQAFCRTCGAKVPHLNAARGRVVVPAGSLDDDPGAREELHIFVGSKAPWYEIADDLPQH